MKLTQLIRNLSVGFSLFLGISTAYAAFPLWTFSPNINYPPQLSINPNQTTTVVYTVSHLGGLVFQNSGQTIDATGMH